MRYVVAAGVTILLLFCVFSAPGSAREPASPSYTPLTQSQCTPVDLRQGSLATVAPTSQNSHGDCYIHAGVGMFQGFLKRTGALTPERTPSPEFVMAQALAHATTVNGESVAVSFDEEKMGRYANRSGAKLPNGLLDSFFDADFEGGRACHTVGRVRKDGTCSAQFVANRAIFYSGLDPKPTTDYLVALRSYVKGEIQRVKGAPRVFASGGTEADCGTKSQGGTTTGTIIRTFGLSPTRLLYDAYLVKNRNREDAATLDLEALMIQTLVDQDLATCTAMGSAFAKDELEFPECSAIGFVEKSDHRELLEPQVLGDSLHYLLAKNRNMSNPPAIEFCSSALRGEDGLIQDKRLRFSKDLTYLNDPIQSKQNFKKSCGFHVALVVGRKWEDGSCKILVQDSNVCGGARCEKDGSGEPIPNTHVHVVDETVLSKNIVRIATIGGFDEFKNSAPVKDVTPAGGGHLPPSLLKHRDEIVPKMNQTRDVDDMGR